MSNFSFTDTDITDRIEKVKRLKAELTQVEAELDVLQKAKSVLSGHTTEPAKKITIDREGSKYGVVKNTVREGIKLLLSGDNFTVRDVDSIFDKDTNRPDRAALSTYLKEFRDEGLLDVVSKGKGRIPTVYRVSII